MFVDEPVLAEMILEMLPPPPRTFGPLALSEVQRTGQPLACPQCGDAMKATTIHAVELDHCPKHGVWFDQDELRIMLYRTGLPANPPPFRDWAPAPQPPRAPLAKPPAEPDPSARRLVFVIDGEHVATQTEVVKIGSLQTATIRIVDDESVSQLHAIVEAMANEVTLIDLGSNAGSYVNGKRVTKVELAAGDRLRFGRTEMSILI